MFVLEDIIRENIKRLVPYSSARSEFKGRADVYLDANENSFGSAGTGTFNRYPDPYQAELKEKISKLKSVAPEKIFLGNGSDEPIDILFRVFCEPGKSNAIILPPTYGMYEVSANINDIELKRVNLDEDFQVKTDEVISTIDSNTRLIFLCCPNNPSGTSMKAASIYKILENFSGLVVLDEAYIDFASYPSLLSKLDQYPNLVILQTFSKAWGLANLRIGMAFASAEILTLMNKVKPPYNISGLTQKTVIEALIDASKIKEWIETIVEERKKLDAELKKLTFVIKVYPSEANFLLVKVRDPKKLYEYLVTQKIIVRDRSKIELCEGCLRITVGTQKENIELLKALNNFK